MRVGGAAGARGITQMPRIEESVVINRPAAEVFAFISDLENDPPWTSATEMRRTSQGPIGIGTTFRQRDRFLGRHLELSHVVVGYEKDRRIAVKATSRRLSLEGARIVDPVGDSATRVTISGDGHASGLLTVVEGLMVAMGARRLRSQLVRLKHLLELPTSGEQPG